MARTSRPISRPRKVLVLLDDRSRPVKPTDRLLCEGLARPAHGAHWRLIGPAGDTAVWDREKAARKARAKARAAAEKAEAGLRYARPAERDRAAAILDTARTALAEANAALQAATAALRETLGWLGDLSLGIAIILPDEVEYVRRDTPLRSRGGAR